MSQPYYDVTVDGESFQYVGPPMLGAVRPKIRVPIMAVIEALNLNFALGCVMKYVTRCGRKPGCDAIDDLKKARWYLDQEITRLSRKDRNAN